MIGRAPLQQLTISLLILVCPTANAHAQGPLSPSTNNPVSRVWVADKGDGTYQNPIIYADYSDPDVIRVGDDFYLTASSFNVAPGLPILHSKDLVNWTIIGHAFARQPPLALFETPQHGKGVWAPAIRYHKGEFYIYYGDPDQGIYVTKAINPAGPWSEPLLIKEVKGWIDPCPFWDTDGKAYLVSALAASRSGIKSILVISRMNAEGTKLLDEGVLVFDGHKEHPTVEGPKLYKRNNYYYIFAPAGGVTHGWQLVLRSKNIYGPYEEKIVLAQGQTAINGPHQGGWVETQTGESWFIHFQDLGAYGRVVHLQPMRWEGDWPMMGHIRGPDVPGEPVLTYKKPNVGREWPIVTPPDSDEFNENGLGLQWQWHANPKSNWAFPSGALGALRLYTVPLPAGFKNLWGAPNLLLQKFPAPEFSVTTKVIFTSFEVGEKTGLIVMGQDYAYLAIKRTAEGLSISQVICEDAEKGSEESESLSVGVKGNTFYLRVDVATNAVCRFSYSMDGKNFKAVGDPFTARQGRWIGAKVGIFAARTGMAREIGYADYDWFRVNRLGHAEVLSRGQMSTSTSSA